jgi:hypothetical protein
VRAKKSNVSPRIRPKNLLEALLTKVTSSRLLNKNKSLRIH